MSNEKKFIISIILGVVLVSGLSVYNRVIYKIYFSDHEITKCIVVDRYMDNRGSGFSVSYLYKIKDATYKASYHSSKYNAYPERYYYVVYNRKDPTKNIFVPTEYDKNKKTPQFSKKELMKHIGGSNRGKIIKKGNWKSTWQ